MNFNLYEKDNFLIPMCSLKFTEETRKKITTVFNTHSEEIYDYYAEATTKIKTFLMTLNSYTFHTNMLYCICKHELATKHSLETLKALIKKENPSLLKLSKKQRVTLKDIMLLERKRATLKYGEDSKELKNIGNYIGNLDIYSKLLAVQLLSPNSSIITFDESDEGFLTTILRDIYVDDGATQSTFEESLVDVMLKLLNENNSDEQFDLLSINPQTRKVNSTALVSELKAEYNLEEEPRSYAKILTCLYNDILGHKGLKCSEQNMRKALEESHTPVTEIITRTLEDLFGNMFLSNITFQEDELNRAINHYITALAGVGLTSDKEIRDRDHLYATIILYICLSKFKDSFTDTVDVACRDNLVNLKLQKLELEEKQSLLASRLEEIQKTQSELEIMKKQYEEKLNLLTTENTKLKSQLIKKDSQIDKLKERRDNLLTQVEDYEYIVNNLKQEASTTDLTYEEMLEEINNHSIIYLGGNPEFQMKLKSNFHFDKILNIDDTKENSIALNSAEAVFVDVTFTGHSSYYKMKDILSNSNAQYVVPYTNDRRFVEELYSKLMSITSSEAI